MAAIGAPSRREAEAAIWRAFELGITLFDSTQAYGFEVSERILGEALRPELRSRRDTLLRDASAGWLHHGVERSLRNLYVDYIDLYQVHWPDPKIPIEETARTLAQLAEEGKIRYVGVSNYDVDQMRAFERTWKLDTLQPPYHLFRRDVEEAILRYCLGHGPLAHGLPAGGITRGPEHTAGASAVETGTSPRSAGYALRFPRIVRPRDDKRAEAATTEVELVELAQLAGGHAT